MRLTTTLAAAAAIAISGAAANAGGLAPAVGTSEPVVIVDTPAAMGGSISPGLIVLGVLGALVAASASF